MRLDAFKVLVPVLCLALVSCASLSAGDKPSLYLEKKAQDPSVYFVQIPSLPSVRQQENEILQRTAAQIAMRQRVFVRYTVSGGGDRAPQQISFLTDYERGNLIVLADQLEVIKTASSGTGIQALVQYKGRSRFPSRSVSAKASVGKDGNPSWVSRPPKGSGFWASVGAVSMNGDPADGFMNADSCAIASLAVYAGRSYGSRNTKIYEAELQGAYIANRWYNASTKTWYSLAVLPR
jgi:hypothetical protein